jgi:cysteine desulfurase
MMADQIVYLDHNSTTPFAQEVIDDIKYTSLHVWMNPSSQHVLGVEARGFIERSRGAIGRMINGRPEDVVFMSGGTEV